MDEITFVYFLQSCSDPKHFYVGITLASRKEQRLSEHNRGQTRSTRNFVPWVCIWFEEYPTKSEAAKRERYLKSVNGYKERREICETHKQMCSVG